MGEIVVNPKVTRLMHLGCMYRVECNVLSKLNGYYNLIALV